MIKGDRSCLFYMGLLILFMAWPMSPCEANYAFSSSPTGGEERSFIEPEQGSFEESMHQCVEDICSDYNPDKTYSNFFSEVSAQASQNTYFETKVWPQIDKLRKAELRSMALVRSIYKRSKEIKGPIELEDELHKTLSFINSMHLFANSFPTVDGFLALGPNRVQHDFGIILGKTLDAEKFLSMQRNGHWPGVDIEIAKSVIENRDFSDGVATLGNSENPLVNLYESQGKGAKSFWLNQFRSYSQFITTYPDIPHYVKSNHDRGRLLSRKQFVEENFDGLLTFASISTFSFDFFSDSFYWLIPSIYPWFDKMYKKGQLHVPKTITADEIEKLKVEISKNLNEVEDVLGEEKFREEFFKSCQWKINFIHSGLPSTEELTESKPKVTSAIVQFQSWLFANFSPETATAIFDFLRGWDFFYPPSKEDFEKVLNAYLSLPYIGPNFGKGDFNEIILLSSYKNGVGSFSQGSTVASNVKSFCDSLIVKPVSDRASPSVGQVSLSWMSLKDPQLLKSVVWHELGHIVSGLVKGANKWDIGAAMFGIQNDYVFSEDSFVHYLTARQCLGEIQDQEVSGVVPLADAYKTWFEEGRLAGFELQDDSLEETLVVGTQYLWEKVSSGTLKPAIIPAKVTLELKEFTDFDETSAVLAMIDGQFVEEDWADLVASRVDPNQPNHFCFMLKNRDHYFWKEEKDKVESKNKEPKENTDPENQSEEDIKRHSTDFFRLLHTEVLRRGTLPRSCRQVQQKNPKYQKIRRCDYF